MADPKGYLVVPCGFNPSRDLRALELTAADLLKVDTGLAFPSQYNIYAWDGANWQKVSSDINGKLNVNTGLSFPTEYDQYGYDGANWKKMLVDASGNQIIDGLSPSIYHPLSAHAVFSNTNLPAGTSTQTIFTCPASQTIRMTNFSFVFVGASAGVIINSSIKRGASYIRFQYIVTPTSLGFYPIAINAILSPGDAVVCLVSGITAGDDLYCDFIAERIN
jgi:hypothetical protein